MDELPQFSFKVIDWRDTEQIARMLQDEKRISLHFATAMELELGWNISHVEVVIIIAKCIDSGSDLMMMWMM